MESIYGASFGGSAVCDPNMGLGSLEEMINSDIKADFDDVLQNSQEEVQNMEGVDLLDSLDQNDLRFDDGLSGVVTNNLVTSTNVNWNLPELNPTLNHPQITSSLSSGSSVGSPFSGNYMDDFSQGSNIMVNPNNVMPVSTVGSSSMMTQPAHVAQLRTTNSLHGNLSINTQFSNVQHPQAPSPAQQSPHYPQPQQLMSPMVTTTYQSQQPQQTGPITVAGHGNVQHIQLRPQQIQVPNHQQIVRPNVITGPSGLNKSVKVLPPGSPMQQVPSPVVHNASQGSVGNAAAAAGAAAIQHSQSAPNSNRKKTQKAVPNEKENGFPKPGYSYSCLIALALKNSHSGSLSVSEIYKFMCEHFPYFKTAPSGWKNSVRHNLSLNKCFEKIEKPSAAGTNQRKGCLWAMNPAKISKMDEEVLKWSRKDPNAIKKGMVAPHTLEKLERGEMVKDYNANTPTSGNTTNTNAAVANAHIRIGDVSEDEEDPKTPTSLSSQSSSQGYDSAGSDFVDIEGFNTIPDSSLQELQLPASGSLFEDIMDERLQFTPTTATSTATPLSSNNPVVRLANNQPRTTSANGYYPTAIHANYAIAPATSATASASAVSGVAAQQAGMKTVVVTRQEGANRVFTVGGLN